MSLNAKMHQGFTVFLETPSSAEEQVDLIDRRDCSNLEMSDTIREQMRLAPADFSEATAASIPVKENP